MFERQNSDCGDWCQPIQRAAQKTLDELNGLMSPNDKAFFRRTYFVDLDVYRQRIRALGLDRAGKVLDAGCGFGQWTACLGSEGVEVHAMDISPLRAHVVQTVCREAGIDSVTAFSGRLDRLPLEENSFDAIFCYGALFLSDWRTSLREFGRILKPGGKLYFSANEIGWHVRLWMEQRNKVKDYDPREVAAASLRNTLDYELTRVPPEKGQVIIAKDQALEALEGEGFGDILIREEGTINLYPDMASPKPFFPGTYKGLPACYEVLATRL